MGALATKVVSMTKVTPQNYTKQRDRFNLTRRELLDDYSQISSRRKNAAETTALRLESKQYLEILCHQASGGNTSFNELERLLSDGDLKTLPRDFDGAILGAIGRVLLLQNFEPEDRKNGIQIIREAIRRLPKNLKSRRYRKLLVEYLIDQGNFGEAEELLDQYPDLNRIYHSYLRNELLNPFMRPHGETNASWLDGFNAPLIGNGLLPVRIEDWVENPFNGLKADDTVVHEQATEDGPLVSVVMTTYNPNIHELKASIGSILNQTYKKLELIIVDDCSSIFPEQQIQDILAKDSRIQFVKTEKNAGTYIARNLGFSVANGEYLTGQDDDDWSHPERIKHQVAFLNNDLESPGCKVKSITCSPLLGLSRIGYEPENPNASSLMVRRSIFNQAGGFLPIRKAADTELSKRIEKMTGTLIGEIDLPLTFVRILSDSLSRSEFRAGWSHPARRQFKSSYNHWHAQSEPKDLQIQNGQLPEISVPRRFWAQKAEADQSFQVVFAGDWRQYGGPQKSMIEEIRALKKAGMKIGVLHLEAPRFMSSVVKSLCAAIQVLINEGVVGEVLYDDMIDVELLILRYPPILQFVSAHPSALNVKKMIILANQAPSELDGSDIRYLVDDCLANARTNFCTDVVWVPQGPQVREAIEPYLSSADIVRFNMPGILHVDDWWNETADFKSNLPVIGRHSRDNAMKWPEDEKTLLAVYPRDGQFDVRVMGGAEVPRRILSASRLPSAWTVYRTDELPVVEFLHSLDFFVFYQHNQAVEAFGRAILEAIASGIVVVIPKQYREVFGPAAIYAEAEEVGDVIRKYRGSRKLYDEQRAQAYRSIADHFSHESYQNLIQSILEKDSFDSFTGDK